MCTFTFYYKNRFLCYPFHVIKNPSTLCSLEVFVILLFVQPKISQRHGFDDKKLIDWWHDKLLEKIRSLLYCLLYPTFLKHIFIEEPTLCRSGFALVPINDKDCHYILRSTLLLVVIISTNYVSFINLNLIC